MSNIKDIDDKTLVLRFQQKNDNAAFEELVQRYSSRAYQISYAILNSREDAEEVVQDAFMRAYKALAKFRGDSSFYTWIYRIVMNLSRNRVSWNKVRGKGKNQSLDAPLKTDKIKGANDLKLDLPDDRLDPVENLSLDELKEKMMEAMKELPEIYRTAILLRNVKGLGHEEIAKLLNCKIGTVKSRIARARDELRKVLGIWMQS